MSMMSIKFHPEKLFDCPTFGSSTCPSSHSPCSAFSSATTKRPLAKSSFKMTSSLPWSPSCKMWPMALPDSCGAFLTIGSALRSLFLQRFQRQTNSASLCWTDLFGDHQFGLHHGGLYLWWLGPVWAKHDFGQDLLCQLRLRFVSLPARILLLLSSRH